MEPTGANWNCEETQAQLVDYLDGVLAPEVQAAFESHIASCAECAPMVARVGGLVRDMEGIEPLPEPPGLADAILRNTLGPRHVKSGAWTWLNWFRPLSQPRLAYGALSLFVTAIVLSQALGIEWRKPVAADLHPRSIYNLANREAHQWYARSVKIISDLRVVYEIQTRLRPEFETEQAPEKPPTSPGRSRGPDQIRPPRLGHAEKSDAAQMQTSFVVPSLSDFVAFNESSRRSSGRSIR